MNATFQGFELTTEHSTSSYGIPVLIYQGEAYGPDERLDKSNDPIGHLLPDTSTGLVGRWPHGVEADMDEPVRAELRRRFMDASGRF